MRRSQAHHFIRTYLLLFILIFPARAISQTLPPQEATDIPVLSIDRAAAAPVIDGVLADDAWKKPPLPMGDWLSYNPLYGERIPQSTQVWVTYDEANLYIAFHCLDPEPTKIKTTLSRRDNQWSDDWVGLSLDALGAGQSSYDMFVNPSGIQGDIFATSTAGERLSVDWVWESAARITEAGYDVEIRVPLESIRFKSGKEVHMGILFWRRVSRLGMSVSWPHLPPGGQWVFGRHATIVLGELKAPLTLEAIPSLTYSLNQSRVTEKDFGPASSRPDAGVTVKYGLTSSLTLEGTLNPDFSQVESDAFQVEVNQRFPIFFSEKRPFFMEGGGTFELAGSTGDSNMRTAVHTRRIIDPIFGLKLTGTVGKLTFATLSAADEAPGRLFSDSAINSDRYENKLFNIARAVYNLGNGSYVGGILTDTEFATGHNRVAGGDLSWQLSKNQKVSATFLSSNTLSPDGDVGQSGFGGQAMYFYDSKRYLFITQVEHYDPGFQMDTAFLNRTGITRGWSFAAYSLYPDAEKYPWFKRFVPFVYSEYGTDRQAGGREFIGVAGVRMHFTRQGFFRFDVARGQEPWADQVFRIGFVRTMGFLQPTKWFQFGFQSRFSRSVFYDPVSPFAGNSRSQSLELSFQPSTRFNQAVHYNYLGFNRMTTGERVFTVHVLNTRTTYQFTRRFFLRGILQYDSSRYRALTDFLASYELVPGTVAYLGYGSLIEKRSYLERESFLGSGDYLTTHRGLFLKLSYLHRF